MDLGTCVLDIQSLGWRTPSVYNAFNLLSWFASARAHSGQLGKYEQMTFIMLHVFSLVFTSELKANLECLYHICVVETGIKSMDVYASCNSSGEFLLCFLTFYFFFWSATTNWTGRMGEAMGSSLVLVYVVFLCVLLCEERRVRSAWFYGDDE
jgi:hypothetical protein